METFDLWLAAQKFPSVPPQDSGARETLASELYYHHNPKKSGFNWAKENQAEKKLFYGLADVALKRHGQPNAIGAGLAEIDRLNRLVERKNAALVAAIDWVTEADDNEPFPIKQINEALSSEGV